MDANGIILIVMLQFDSIDIIRYIYLYRINLINIMMFILYKISL